MSWTARGGKFYFTGALATNKVDNEGVCFSPEALAMLLADITPGYPIQAKTATLGDLTVGWVERAWMEPDEPDLTLMIRGYTTIDILPLATALCLISHGKYSHYEVEYLRGPNDSAIEMRTIRNYSLEGLFLGANNSEPGIKPVVFDVVANSKWN